QPAGDDAVAVFSRNSTTGMLSFVEAQFDGVGGVSGLAGAGYPAFSPDGTRFYVVSGTNLVEFNRNPVSGSLTFVELNDLGVINCEAHVSPGGLVATSVGNV